MLGEFLEIAQETSKSIGEVSKEVGGAVADIGKATVQTADPIQAFREIGREIGKEETEYRRPPLTAEERASQERRAWAEAQWAAITKEREKNKSQEHDLER